MRCLGRKGLWDELAVNLGFSRRTLGWWIVAFLAGASVCSVQLAAQVKEKAAGPTSSPPTPTSTERKSAKKSARKRVRASRSRRRDSYRYRLARLHPEPQRVVEIQRALIQAGYLHEDSNGKWDEPTREAMLRFQREHSFPATGLPEAKSLMKLGLGPHPLPEDADPSVAARATVDASPKAAATPSADPPRDRPPANSDQPHKEQ